MRRFAPRSNTDYFQFPDLANAARLMLFAGHNDAQRTRRGVQVAPIAAEDKERDFVGHPGIKFRQGKDSLVAIRSPYKNAQLQGVTPQSVSLRNASAAEPSPARMA